MGSGEGLAACMGPPVTTLPSLLSPSCSHPADTLFPGHSVPFLDNLSLQCRALCQEGLLLFLENFSSFKIQLGSPLFHEATLDSWGGISHAVLLFPGHRVPTSAMSTVATLY